MSELTVQKDKGIQPAAGRQKAPVELMLEKMKGQFALVLPKHLTADRMVRIALTVLRKTPKLLQCDPQSFVGAVMVASQLGLEPDGMLGHGYLIPYGKEVQFVPGYKGLLELARRSGSIISISARVVRAKDDFFYQFGLHEDLKHVPCDDDDPGQMTHVYAVAHLKDGGHQMEVMPISEVKAIRDGSKGYQTAKQYGKDSPWDTHPEEMAKKTVLRRLCKMLPASTELARAVVLDERADAGIEQGNVFEVDQETGEVLPAPVVEGRRMPLKGSRSHQATPAAAAEEREPGADDEEVTS